MKADCSSEAGFTLVDLLVTLALLSLMVIYSMTAFSMLKDLDRVSGDAEAQHEVDAVSRHIRDVLADARVWFDQEHAGQPRLLFQGKAQELQLVAVSNGERETGGLYALRFFVDDDRKLISDRIFLQGTSTDSRNTAILLRGVPSVRFWYAAKPSSDGELAFEDEWTLEDSLPFAVRMSVKFADGDRRRWPETAVLVRAAR